MLKSWSHWSSICLSFCHSIQPIMEISLISHQKQDCNCWFFKLLGWLRMNMWCCHGHGMWSTFLDQSIVIWRCSSPFQEISGAYTRTVAQHYFFSSTVRMDGGREVASDHVSEHPAIQLPGTNSLNVMSIPSVTCIKATLDTWWHSCVSWCIVQGGLGWDACVGIWEDRTGVCRRAGWPKNKNRHPEWWGRAKGLGTITKPYIICHYVMWTSDKLIVGTWQETWRKFIMIQNELWLAVPSANANSFDGDSFIMWEGHWTWFNFHGLRSVWKASSWFRIDMDRCSCYSCAKPVSLGKPSYQCSGLFMQRAGGPVAHHTVNLFDGEAEDDPEAA